MKTGKKIIGFITLVILTFSSLNLKADIDAWPFLELSKDSTTICYPFYTREGDFKMILNLYANTDNGREQHIFWPFIKVRDGKLARVAPLWFMDDNDEYVFLPFIYENADFTFWSFPPMYLAKNEEFNAVIPFYIKNDDTLFIFPNTLIKEGHREKSIDIFPFYSHTYSTSSVDSDSELRAGWFIHRNNNLRKSTILFPFYFSEIAKHDESESSVFLLPYYREWNDSRNYSRYVLFPFMEGKSSPEENYTWAFNYYNYKSESKESFNIFPFYGETEEVDPKTERTKESMWVLWPFYSREKEIDSKGSIISKNNRFMIFSNNLDKYGRRTFSVLGAVVSERVN